MMSEAGGHGDVRIRVAGEEDAGVWADYVGTAGLDGHFHEFAWRRIIETSLRHRALYLIARRRDEVTGVLPLFDVQSRLFGRSLVSVPFLNGGGLVASDWTSERALLAKVGEIIKHGGYRYSELRQRGPFGHGAEDLSHRQHKVAMRLALGDDPEALFKGFKGKLRSQIRRSGKAGAKAQMINGANVVDRDLAAFYKVFAENMRDLGTPVFPRSLFETTIDGFQERVWLGLVWVDDHPAAAGLMVGAGNINRDDLGVIPSTVQPPCGQYDALLGIDARGADRRLSDLRFRTLHPRQPDIPFQGAMGR